MCVAAGSRAISNEVSAVGSLIIADYALVGFVSPPAFMNQAWQTGETPCLPLKGQE
jgi:hypothetical protein